MFLNLFFLSYLTSFFLSFFLFFLLLTVSYTFSTYFSFFSSFFSQVNFLFFSFFLSFFLSFFISFFLYFFLAHLSIHVTLSFTVSLSFFRLSVKLIFSIFFLSLSPTCHFMLLSLFLFYFLYSSPHYINLVFYSFIIYTPAYFIPFSCCLPFAFFKKHFLTLFKFF